MNDAKGFGFIQLLIAFLAGAAAGSAVVLLTAPRAGRETREALQGWAREVRGKSSRFAQAAERAKEAFADSLREERPRGEA